MASVLFSPLRLAGLTLKNRIVVSPMCMYSALDGIPQPWHLMHVGHLAISGASLVIMEATGVEPVGRISDKCLGLWNDAQEEALGKLIRDVRSFSPTPLGIQLGHAGRKGSCHPGWIRRGNQIPVSEGGWSLVGPSPVAWGEGWTIPQALDEDGMAAVKRAFVAAARRADRCGFDLIEIHGAHGYLLNSFISPLSNFRTDRYGGSLENRMRFPLEVVSAIRDAWPRGKPLGIRINGDDWHERGSGLNETVAYARALSAVGVDYVTLSAGNGAPDVRFPPIEPGYLCHFAERVRREAGVTTAAVGMILFPEQAEHIISSDTADLVMLARGMLDDPRWPWHAAIALGEPADCPQQYAWAQPKGWRGYKLVHPS